jgi:pimeloyl-ACP methyl ester carboxylesterase
MSQAPAYLISGWAHGVEAMESIAQSLGPTRRVRSFSVGDRCAQAPGQEASSPQAGLRDLSPYALRVAEAVEEAREPVCLIGWSTGAMVALEVAARLQDGIAALVLLSATARFCSCEGYAPGVPKGALRAMCRDLGKRPEAVLFDFFARACFPLSVSGDDLARRTEIALRSGAAPLIQGLEYLQRVDLREALDPARQPCLVIHGQEDQIIPPDAAVYLSDNLVNASSLFVPGAGHMIIEQRKVEIAHRIKAFLETLP